MAVSSINTGANLDNLTNALGAGFDSNGSTLGSADYGSDAAVSFGPSAGGANAAVGVAADLAGISDRTVDVTNHVIFWGMDSPTDFSGNGYKAEITITRPHLRDYITVYSISSGTPTALTPASNSFTDTQNNRIYFKRGKLNSKSTIDTIYIRWVDNEHQVWMHDADEGSGLFIAKCIDSTKTTAGYCGLGLKTDSSGRWDNIYTGTIPLKWVDDGGSDSNAGTKAAPWGTLRHSLSNMDAGGVLFSRTANYSQSVRDGQDGYVKGTNWYNPSVFAAYNNETVWNNNTGGVPSFNFGGGASRNLANSYIVFLNINADGQNAHPEPGFIFTAGASKFRLVGCKSRRHGVTGGAISVGFQETFHNDPDDGGRLSNYDVIYIDCDAYENAGSHGMYITRSGTTVEFGRIYDNGGMGISWQPLPHLGQSHGQNGKIRNNRIWGNGYRDKIGQAGIYIAYQIGLQCYNNYVYHNTEAGILLGGLTSADGNDGVLIFHNVVWKNGLTGKNSSLKYGIYGHGDGSGPGSMPVNNLIKNNIVSGNFDDTIFLPPHFDSSNKVVSNYFSDPGFVDPDNANRLLADFSLSSEDDPVVDAGASISVDPDPMSDVVSFDFLGFPRPSLDGYDIGAHEWSATSSGSSNPIISGPSSLSSIVGDNVQLSPYDIENIVDPGTYTFRAVVHTATAHSGA